MPKDFCLAEIMLPLEQNLREVPTKFSTFFMQTPSVANANNLWFDGAGEYLFIWSKQAKTSQVL